MMQKPIHIFLFVLGLISTFKAEGLNKKIPGQIISLSWAAIDVTFIVDILPSALSDSIELDFDALQYKVKYIDSQGKKNVLKPEDAKEIRFECDCGSWRGITKVRMLSRNNTAGLGSIVPWHENLFLRLISDGNLKLFYFYRTAQTSGSFQYPSLSYTDVLQKGKGTLKKITSIGFKSEMAEYFSDCPALHEKIESREFREKELLTIIDFYNTKCS